MATIKYEVIGSPVRVSANCEDISVTICWTGRTIYDDDCNDQYRDERICSAITITPGDTELTGSITWNGKTVEYVIYRNCPDPAPSSCTVTCSELDVYSVPKYIKKDYSDPIDIHYQYYLTCENEETGYIGSRTKKIGVKTIGVNDLDSSKCYEFVGEGGCKEKVCVGDKVDPCDAGNRLYLSVSLSQNTIPSIKTNDEGYPVLDDGWSLIPAYACMDKDKKPTPIPEDPSDQNYVFKQKIADVTQCYDDQKNPRYKENKETHKLIPNGEGNAIPIPYFTVTVTISYKLITVDDECKKVTQNGIITRPWRIPACENGCSITAMAGGKILNRDGKIEIKKNGGNVSFSVGNNVKPSKDTHPCCFGHYIEGSVPISEIKKILEDRGKLDSDDATIYYNGLIYGKDDITYSVYVKPKTDGECQGLCEETIKYGVVKGTTKVFYETEYMSNEWVSPDLDDCSCNGLIITDDEGHKSGKYYVPFYGGRIKVTWDYVRHYTSEECEESYNYGTWDEIIMIGGCDERPKDCNTCYGHTTHDDKNEEELVSNCNCEALSIYDNTCQSCDAECCYTDTGGRCNLLFKEQLVELWDDTFKCDNGKSQLNVYRCKRCGAITPIMSDNNDCSSEAPKKCPACGFNTEMYEIEFDYSNEFVSTPYYTCSNCGASLQSPGIDENCEQIPPDKCPYCKQTWNYDETKHNSGVTSDWYNKISYEFEQDCNKPCNSKEYKQYKHLNVVLEACDSGTKTYDVDYTKSIEYVGEGCPPNEVKNLKDRISVTVEENNTGIERVLINDERITVVQKAGPCKETGDCGCSNLEITEQP